MTQTSRPIPLAALGDNLKRLCWIRWIVLAMQCAAVVYVADTGATGIRYGVLAGIIMLYAVVNIVTLAHLRRGRATPSVTEWAFFAHLLFDVLILSLFLYCTGGSTNPFISFFLVPICISAATLARSFTWTLTGLTAALYFLMLHYYVPVAWFGADHGQYAAGAFNPHILGMWFNFVVSAALITWFVVQMASALREHDRALDQARETMLRNEQVVAVATLAAGTAHRLGTPLSTMIILLDELAAEHAANEPLRGDLTVLREQVDRCKDTLRGLVDAARQQNILDRKRSPAADYFARVIDDWRICHPQTVVSLQQRLPEDVEIEHEETLDQAIVHLLDNAAESGSEVVEVSVTGEARDTVCLQVRDYGGGLPAGRDPAPDGPDSTKTAGFGLGLLLSRATVARYGGGITLFNHESGGAVAELRLPRADSTR